LVEGRSLGFHLDRRSADSPWQRLTRSLIPAEGLDQQPHSYCFDDQSVPLTPGLRYRLVAIGLSGEERVLGETAAVTVPILRILRRSDELVLELRGEPHGSLSLEVTSEATSQPWSRLETITLDDAGRAVVVRPVDQAATALFYRATRMSVR
jgi:hypothetical protein